MALQLRETPISVTVASGVAAIRADLRVSEREVFVVELTAEKFLDTFELLQTVQDDYPLIRVIVVGELALQYEWQLREFGAVTVAKYVWQAHVPAQIIVRHLLADRDALPNSDTPTSAMPNSAVPDSDTLPNSNPGE